VAFLHTEMSEVIRPEGWAKWRNTDENLVARYAEFENSGAGARTNNRVAWSRQLSPTEAAAYAVENVLGGPDHWKP
jgi:pectinesterase